MRWPHHLLPILRDSSRSRSHLRPDGHRARATTKINS